MGRNWHVLDPWPTTGEPGGRPRLPREPACYAVYCDGKLVYVGQTMDLSTRLRKHGFDYARYSNSVITPWGQFGSILIKYRPSRKFGDWAMIELRFIRRLHPRFNGGGFAVRSRDAKRSSSAGVPVLRQ